MPEDRLFHSCLGQSDKVNSLTDFEEIVWRDYINAADDFGVMRFSAVTLQAKFDRLAQRPAKVIERALESVLAVDLIRTFTHQSRVYCFQWDWQDWQHITYPRRTAQPLPSGEALLACSIHTRRLFTLHPDGGKLEGGWKAAKGWQAPHVDLTPSGDSPESVRSDSGESPETVRSNSSFARTALAVSHSVSRLPLAVDRSGDERGLDILLDEFLREHYPKEGYAHSWETDQAWIAAFEGQDRQKQYSALCVAVAQHKRSIQWAVDRKIPSVTRWLKEQRWHQELPEPHERRSTSDRMQRIAAANEEFLK
jgi:hypothetical protein